MKVSNQMKMAAAGLALAAGSPIAQAQTAPPPIKIGILDTDASGIADARKGVSVHHQSFIGADQKPGSHKTATGKEHGEDVAASFLDQSWRIDPSRRVEIYSAGAFFRSGNERMDEQNNRPMSINYEAANKALDWFKANGVKVVVTTFVVKENPSVKALMDKAADLGLVVFSSTHNTQSAFMPFPAHHPAAISVTGNARNLDFETNSSMKNWVMFQADAGIPGKSLTVTPENGSSFAVARAAAFGAHLADKDPEIPRSEVVEDLNRLASSSAKAVPSLAGRDPIIQMRVMLQIPDAENVALISMGPSKPRIAQAPTMSSPKPVAAAVMASSAMGR